MHVDGVNLKALPSIITCSEKGKQNIQAKKVYKPLFKSCCVYLILLIFVGHNGNYWVTSNSVPQYKVGFVIYLVLFMPFCPSWLITMCIMDDKP